MAAAGVFPRAEARIGRALEVLARAMAFLGGLILAMLSAMVVVSIIGRALDGLWFFGPIKGDYELVEHGTAIAVFAFLPWCQLKRGHVAVDIVSQRLPLRVQAVMGLIGDILIAVVAYIVAWRLYAGFTEKFPYGSDGLREALGMAYRPFFPETTYELEIPVWIPYVICVAGAGVFMLVSVYTVWRSLNWVLRGREEVA